METLVYKRPESLLKDGHFTFCPGCGHGVVLRIIAELIDEFNLQKDTIAISSVGCSIFSGKVFQSRCSRCFPWPFTMRCNRNKKMQAR